ncbi:hypothetical protein [Massilia sp. H6]|uniref:hypothetical protein n=1 Tax=Massilia sp. H6 TaxID=2970464 RepID=UPI002168EE90|nr:hypothetical protein [Massilia sp. H6]UVW27115.1 hypothetical protein NRS07_11105 [Massilia sp. H6]
MRSIWVNAEALVKNRFVLFLLVSRWVAAIVATMYHARFLLFVNYDAAHDKGVLTKAFYFVTGLGHESYAVFFILDGIIAGLLLRRYPPAASASRAVFRHAASLYLILLPGLLVGASLDLAGSRLFGASGVYTDFPAFSVLSLSLTTLLANLLMLQPFVVPNFGSNSMLYLLSYLFWALILLFALVRARAPLVRGALCVAVVLIMPPQFLVWAAIWLTGVALVFLSEARAFRPPPLLALALCGGALVLSRMLGSMPSLPPAPFGELVVQGGFWLVGVGFAGLAWALYPRRSQDAPAGLASPAIESADGWAGQTASFTFFCHFPVIMLAAAMGASLFDDVLMQQPVAATYLRFAALVATCIAVAAFVTRGSAAVARALAVRKHVRA